MKTLYLDCGMGAAGDMLTAALLELLPNPAEFVKKLNSLGIPGVIYEAEPSVKCGITGTHMKVTVMGEEEESIDEGSSHSVCHTHTGLSDIASILEDLPLTENVCRNVREVYELIAQAESKAHGIPMHQIHFHEVGSLDAVADVTAVCMLMEELSPDQVIVSPIHVGSGKVRCAHGILPVPAPATAHILQNIPIYGGKIQGELCTPTGAALLRHFASDFGNMPVMKISAIGYGMGKKNFEAANCVRAMLGETQEAEDQIYELSCNLDDMTGEAVGFALEELMKCGALDAFYVPIGMKKNRPGVLLHVICRKEDRQQMVHLIFKHTSTLGIRETACSRYVLDRKIQDKKTTLGIVRKKTAQGYGVHREKYEYEDLARIARDQNMSLSRVKEILAEEKV